MSVERYGVTEDMIASYGDESVHAVSNLDSSFNAWGSAGDLPVGPTLNNNWNGVRDGAMRPHSDEDPRTPAPKFTSAFD